MNHVVIVVCVIVSALVAVSLKESGQSNVPVSSLRSTGVNDAVQ